MSPLLVAGVAVGGAAGAVTRLVLDGEVTARRPGPFPAGVVLVNALGSLLLGLLTGLALSGRLPASWLTVAGTGFCGGFTTFSTTSVGGVRLLQQRRPGLAALAVLGTLALTVVVAAAGVVLGAG